MSGANIQACYMLDFSIKANLYIYIWYLYNYYIYNLYISTFEFPLIYTFDVMFLGKYALGKSLIPEKCRNNVHFEYKTSLLIQLNLVYLLALYLLARTKQRANFFLMC